MTRSAREVCVWVSKASVLLLYEASLAAHGGLRGMRDEGLLESALARPKNLLAYLAYKEDASVEELAATYAVGLARNHPFLEGNKRAAFMVLGLFLELNGSMLVAEQPDAVIKMLAVAIGQMDEARLTEWISTFLTRSDASTSGEKSS